MRRALATFVLTLSLFVGATAWSGFLLLNTALDPGRSERMATTLLDDPDVRSQIRDNIARTLEAAVPPEAGLPPDAVADAADAALDSPAVEALVFDAFVASHQAFLGEGEAPRSLESGAFGAAARDALVAEYPHLDGVLPAAPTLEIPLPTQNIPDLSPVRDALRVAVPVMAVVALIGAALALLVTSDRPGVLRRTGFWAIGLSVVVVAFAFGVPFLTRRFLPDQAAVVSGVVDAMAETTRIPALAMAGAGVLALLASLLWRPATRSVAAAGAEPPVSSARRGERARRREATTPRRYDVQPPNRPRPRPRAVAPAAPPVSHGPVTPAYGTPAAPPPPTAARPVAPAPAGPVDADVTRVEPTARPERPGARWVDDVGWVHDGDGPIPPGARFVPGAGYVLPE